MTLEEKIYSVLSGDAAVSAIVGSRIYPERAPQTPQLPLVTYSRVSTSFVHTMVSDASTRRARVQITCWAPSYAAMRDLSDKVILALRDYSGGPIVRAFLENEGPDLFDADLQAYGRVLEFGIWAEA